MVPRGLKGICPAFSHALSRGDLDAAAACFAREGCFITADATSIHGRDRIRPVLGQMVIRGTRIEVELSSTIAAGDVVLARERWKVRTTGSDDPPFEQTLDAILVLQRIESVWKLAVAAPWGWGDYAGS